METREEAIISRPLRHLLSPAAGPDPRAARESVHGFVARPRPDPGPDSSRVADVELELVVCGGAARLVADQRLELRPYTLVWHSASSPRLVVDASQDFAAWRVGFDAGLVRRTSTRAAAALLGNRPGRAPSRLLEPAEAARLITLLEELAQTRDPDAYDAGLAFALARAWQLSGAAGPSPEAREIHSGVEQAAWLLRTQSVRLGRAELAGRCGLSESQLSRLFKRQMGVTLAEFRNRQRIDRFVTLYGNGTRFSLVEAALDAGFGSYPQFHRVFKRMMGRGPAEYARQVRGPASRSQSDPPR